MDFHTHQDAARRKSRVLLWRFCLANIVLLALLNGSLYLIAEWFHKSARNSRGYSDSTGAYPVLESIVPIALPIDAFMLVAIVLAATVQFYRLSSRGGAVAEALGGSRVPPDTTDLLERRYLNVVEEMAIAANVPVPQVYILPDEHGINAFASGPSREDSVVAVTRGALERLSRDELQGVVAHELSHITHGDVPLNIKLSSYIFGLLALYSIGRFILEVVVRSGRGSRRAEDSGTGAAPVAFLLTVTAFAFLIFGLLGRIVAVLMSAAISRQREFLADATAVQFTRNSEGIAGALKKIGGFELGSSIRNRNAPSMSHFFLAQSKRFYFFGSLYSTHPPLIERITRIDPLFKGVFPPSSAISRQSGEESDFVSHFHTPPAQEKGRRASTNPDAVVGYEDAPGFNNLSWMPPAELHDTFIGLGLAETAVLAILFDHSSEDFSKQRRVISAFTAIERVEERARLYASLPLNQRLSIVMMALPTIHGEATAYRNSFRSTVADLIRVDDKVTRFEFLVGTLVDFALAESDQRYTLWKEPPRLSDSSFISHLTALLSVSASCTSPNASECAHLVHTASSAIGVACTYTRSSVDDIPGFIQALRSLRATDSRIRQDVLRALRLITLYDGVTTELETALLRTFAMLLQADLWDAKRR